MLKHSGVTRLLEVLCPLLLMCLSSPSYGAHPLITDDTGTQGKGRFQMELNAELGKDKETEEQVTSRERSGEVAAFLSIGMADAVDLVIGLPCPWSRVREDGELLSDEAGISDLSFELKWRFYEREALSFALKPGMTFPTGNEERGLGTGRVTGSLFLITTAEVEPWAFHLNMGYVRNENRLDERKDLWHVSLAGEVEVLEGLKLVANIGVEENPDKTSRISPAFVLGGLIYSISERVDVDLGFKEGLNYPETDHTLLFGLVFRF